MSGNKNFAVAGAGNIGVFIIEEFLKQKSVGVIDNVYILTRATSNNPDIPRLVALGAKPVGVDYSSTEGLIKALSPLNLDVLISTLGQIGTSLDSHWPLVDAVKAANIKLFVPSEFGNPTEGGYLEWDLAKGKVEAGGDGNVPVSYTARRDISRYLAYGFTHLPAEKLENRAFRIEGDRKTFNELFKQYEERTGAKLNPTYHSEEELERMLRENPTHFSSMLQYSFLTHGGTVGHLDQLDNGEFPGWNPTEAIEFIARN